MEHFFNQIFTFMMHQGAPALYLFLFGSAILENLFPPVPGDTVTVLGAFMVGSGNLRFDLVYLSTTLGSVIGFYILFLLARYLEQGIISRGFFRWITKSNIERAKKTLGRYEYIAILANRFLPGIRSVISISAGLLQMKPLPVLALSTVSAAAWNFIWIMVGYSLGNNWEQVRERIGIIAARYNIIAGSLLAVIVITAIIIHLIRKRRKKVTIE
ncbi:MAG TPA: DedA family protein [Spirochaetota bacterium]